MRVRLCSVMLTLAMLALLPGCGGDGQQTQTVTEASPESSLSETPASAQKPEEEARSSEERTVSGEPDASEPRTDEQADDESSPVSESVASGETTDTASTTAGSAESEAIAIEQSTEEAQDNTMYLQIGNWTLTATLVDNSSTAALKELLAQGPVTIDMRDYGSMEKVGPLGTTLPSNNQQMTTAPGDLILYQGNSFVIYYDANSWSLTRLGKLDGVTPEELREILGGGDVTVTLSMNLQ